MDISGRIAQVIRHGKYVGGPEIAEFESAMASYIGVEHAVAVNSGTDALLFALRVLGVGEEHSVVVPTFTFSATAAAVALAGAKVVFADIREADFGIDVNTIENPDAIYAMIAVDMFGIPGDWPSYINLCGSHRIKLIEDAAQAIGARFAGSKCGSIGMIGCTSFYPSKPLSGIGDGGMVFTNYKSIADKIRKMGNHGRSTEMRYSAEFVGGNSRLDTVQAAVLLERLKHFEIREIPCRISQASDYYDKLVGPSHVKPRLGREPVWSWYPVLYDNKRERDLAFENYGGFVGARIIYPEPLHLMPAFKYLGYKRGDFPVAESVCERILAFPIVHHWEVNRCLSILQRSECYTVSKVEFKNANF